MRKLWIFLGFGVAGVLLADAIDQLRRSRTCLVREHQAREHQFIKSILDPNTEKTKHPPIILFVEVPADSTEDRDIPRDDA